MIRLKGGCGPEGETSSLGNIKIFIGCPNPKPQVPNVSF